MDPLTFYRLGTLRHQRDLGFYKQFWNDAPPPPSRIVRLTATLISVIVKLRTIRIAASTGSISIPTTDPACEYESTC